MSSWSEKCALIIAETIRQVGRKDMKKLRAALREAYPFGERRYYPYKAWCREVKRQLGHPLVAPRKTADDLAQADLFDERIN